MREVVPEDCANNDARNRARAGCEPKKSACARLFRHLGRPCAFIAVLSRIRVGNDGAGKSSVLFLCVSAFPIPSWFPDFQIFAFLLIYRRWQMIAGESLGPPEESPNTRRQHAA